MELTEPLEAAVVNAAQVEEDAMPNLVSLPSILPPDWFTVVMSVSYTHLNIAVQTIQRTDRLHDHRVYFE